MDNSDTQPSSQSDELLRALRREILHARRRVYQAAPPTPLERLDVALPLEAFIKREDLSPIKAYKWRGAFNRMAMLTAEEKAAGVVTASAGNHAQGVALAASILGTTARIYMPRSTPEVKRNAVMKHGAGKVEIVLAGDAYDEAMAAAMVDVEQHGKVYVHAYDDLYVMAGQGTLADEVVMSGEADFDVAFLQIGGGGMASGVACWLKTYYPDIYIIGVEGVGQASMQAAIAAGKPVELEQLDIFSDGTAVRKVGATPFAVCRELIDEYITVSNDELCQAIQLIWESQRCIPEPAGAMGVAGLLQQGKRFAGKRVLTVLCGANVDFGKLGVIASRAGIGMLERRYLRVEISERPGAMLELLNEAFGELNIMDFQYGKTDADRAWPIFGFAADEREMGRFLHALEAKRFQFEEVSHSEDVLFRVIPYRQDLLQNPIFLKLEFYERPGALRDFINQRLSGKANLCYFNYSYSGERVGRALIGLEFNDATDRAEFLSNMARRGDGFRSCEAVDAHVMQRMLCEK